MRSTLSVGLAVLMVTVAIVGGGLAWAFWSFSRGTASQSPGASPEPASPAAGIVAPPSAETTPVPDVLSLPLPAATDTLRDAGFEVDERSVRARPNSAREAAASISTCSRTNASCTVD